MIQWRSAALAGIAAGIVATAAQLALWWAASDPLPAILFRDARLTAAIVMGRAVLPPPPTFDGSVMLIATLIHFALSIVYGLALSIFVSRVPMRPALLLGAAFGLCLYAINMYGFTWIFPWFEATRDGVTAATHVIFGLVAAAVYKTWSMRFSHSARSSDARS
jgi:hypothetical protein